MAERETWCAAPKKAAERIARYEAFWEYYHPKNEEYDDDIQSRAVRRCAYRLAELYLESGNVAKCRQFLKWLEGQDTGFIR